MHAHAWRPAEHALGMPPAKHDGWHYTLPCPSLPLCTCLQLDVAAAMQAGHELLLAANGVLLTAGPLPVRHVRRVQRQDLPLEWQQRRQQQEHQQLGRRR